MKLSKDQQDFYDRIYICIESHFGSKEKAEKWFKTEHQHFSGKSPMQCIQEGEGSKVLKWVDKRGYYEKCYTD